MSKRFFVAPPITESAGAAIKLSDSESHHLISVMRARLQDQVFLFDGTGVEYEARVNKLEKRAVWVEITARGEISREPSTRLSIGVALPKGERQQWLCEKLVELGCQKLTPLHTDRGVAEPGEAALARLRRFVIEASKQCGRNQLMEIGEPCTLTKFFATGCDPGQRMLLDAAGEPLTSSKPSSGSWQVVVGPEGGWTEQELANSREIGVKNVSLGARILRVETAAVAICARICID